MTRDASPETLITWATVVGAAGTFALAAAAAWTLRRNRRERNQDLAPVIVVDACEAPKLGGYELYVVARNVGAVATRLDLEVCFHPRVAGPSAPRSALRGSALAPGGAQWFAAPPTGYAMRAMSLVEARAAFDRITVKGEAVDQAARHHVVDHELVLDTTPCPRLPEPPTEIVHSAV